MVLMYAESRDEEGKVARMFWRCVTNIMLDLVHLGTWNKGQPRSNEANQETKDRRRGAREYGEDKCWESKILLIDLLLLSKDRGWS